VRGFNLRTKQRAGCSHDSFAQTVAQSRRRRYA